MPAMYPFSCRDVLASLLIAAFICLSGQASETAATLSIDECRAVDDCIAKFDADDFQTREEAQSKLMAFGPRIQSLLSLRLRETQQRNGSAEIAARLQSAIRGIEQVEINAVLDGLEIAIDQAPAYYIAPDREVTKRLSEQTITFEWTDAPLRDVLAVISRRTDVQIVFDPQMDGESSADAPITLRIQDMKANLALDWVMRLAELKFLIRGKVAIVTTTARGARLNLQQRRVELSLAPGDAAWTKEETEELAELCKSWPLPAPVTSEEENARGPDWVQAERPGHLLLCAMPEHFDALEGFLKSVGQEPPAPPATPLWFDAIEKRLDEKVSFDSENAPLADVLDMANRRIEASLQLNPKSEADAESQAISINLQNVPGRTFILEFCRRAELCAVPTNGSLCFCKRDQLSLAAEPCILDVRSALKAGIDPAALKTRLDALLADVHQTTPTHLLHGRWLAMVDPWTAQRAAKWIAQVAQQKKLPEAAPEAPWFFATYK